MCSCFSEEIHATQAVSGRDVAAVFEHIDTDRSGSIDRHEYFEFMLLRSGKVKAEDIELIRVSFNSLDKDGDDTVTLDEILNGYDDHGDGVALEKRVSLRHHLTHKSRSWNRAITEGVLVSRASHS
jgi:Ca2+-binding EF-hand superfamily protein